MSPLILALALVTTDGGTISVDAGEPIGGGLGSLGGGGGTTGSGGGNGTTGGGGGSPGGGTGGGTTSAGGGMGGGGGTTGGGMGGGGGTTGGGLGGGGGTTGGGLGGGGGTTGGGMGTGGGTTGGGVGGGGGVVASSDGGTLESWADLSWSASVSSAIAVWVDDRRDRSFRTARRRGADLWMNGTAPDGGLLVPYGQILCPTAVNEVLSSPRIAFGPNEAIVAWMVGAPATSAGQSIRLARLTATGLTSCDGTIVPPDGNPLSSLQVQQSGGEFLMTWETPTQVLGQFLTPPSPPFVITTKFTRDLAFSPRLAATATGFFCAWLQQGQFFGANIPPRGTVPPPQAYFASSPLLAFGPAVASTPLSVAFAAGEPTPHLFAAPLDLATTTNAVVMGPEVGPHSLVAAATASRILVAHQRVPDGFGVTEFSSATVTPPVTAALMPGLEPLAMTAGDRVVLLAGSNSFLRFLTVPPSLGSVQVLGGGVATQASPDQLHPSAVWTDGGVWLAAWNEGPNVVGFQVSATTGDVFGSTIAPLDAGVARLQQVAAGPAVAVSIATPNVSGLFLTTWGAAGIESTPLLAGGGDLPAALVGNRAGALWAPGRDAVTFGRGTRAAQSFGGHRFGRCGAWAEDALWIPAAQGGNGLAVLELSDVEVPTATPHTVGSSGVPVAPPCLAARGSDLLLVGNDDAGNLFVARTTVADVRANRPAIRLNLPARPAARAVLAPVAAPTPTGWQLAWESPGDLGSVIVGMQLDLDGTPHDGSVLTLGLDDRTPVLVPSPGGAVALIWQHFFDHTGSVVVRARLLPQAVLVDGGVITSDAGVGSDGGVGTDGGVSAGDGGLDQALVFTTCGCQSSGAPVVLALALLLVAARRRRPDAR